ncbi:MAG: deoxynucleoside kinase [Nitrospirota bacterium]
MDGKYIVIEGPIGVGKTSLATLLSKELNARLILEKAEENPFLTSFYKDQQRHAFQTQIFFLMCRYKQQQELAQQDLFKRTTISDYLFDKDRIFAYLNLNENELALYEQIFNLLDARITKPDLVIYLQAEVGILLERIKKRAREYEKELPGKYLEDLNEAYNHYFFQYSESPLLVIQTTSIDFVKSRADLDDLIKQITLMKKGTQHYIPLSSR